jgi:hypothetical protein
VPEFDALPEGEWVDLDDGAALWALSLHADDVPSQMILFRCTLAQTWPPASMPVDAQQEDTSAYQIWAVRDWHKRAMACLPPMQ